MSDVSIKEVARLAKVSTATVSRCINEPDRVREDTRTKVQAAIHETGYAPNTLARRFRRGKANVIMVILPAIGDPFFTEVMRGIRRTAKAKGYAIIINETQFNTLTADDMGGIIASKQADGIILLASASPFGTEIVSPHSQKPLPIVIGCETISSDLAGFPSVHIDNKAAATEATDHLISLGHTRIAFMKGEETSLLTKDREAGYRAALQTANIPFQESLLVSGNMTIQGAQEATKSLLNQPVPPTAIFCANDEMAIGALHTIKTAGLNVPADISVMGFDNTRYAAVTDPPLTTIHQPAEEIGERTFLRLCACIVGAEGTSSTPDIVQHSLVSRGSTAPPKP